MKRSICWGGLLVAFSGALALAAATPLAVDIREFAVPTANALPHDPAVGGDGSSLWVTEQRANKLARMDPVSGRFTEFPLKTRDSGPHGLVADREGNIWFTANYKAYIGKLNPQTGVISEYRWPDGRVKDPHTPVIDRAGDLWFTAQNSNFIGRLDPKSGAVRVQQVPTPHAQPYGIIIGADGAPYFCEFGTNKLGRMDPQSMTIREYLLPEGARPRRLTLAPDGTIYYSDYARGFLGRFDPRSERVQEWQSPGGASSRPYGIATTPDGLIWYSESGPKPNTLVRFDPTTKSFEQKDIPSGGGVVRNIVAAPDGRLYLACSGVNRVAIATPPATPKHTSLE
jgi:virginiamycin B lyase